MTMKAMLTTAAYNETLTVQRYDHPRCGASINIYIGSQEGSRRTRLNIDPDDARRLIEAMSAILSDIEAHPWQPQAEEG